MLDNSSNPKE